MPNAQESSRALARGTGTVELLDVVTGATVRTVRLPGAAQVTGLQPGPAAGRPAAELTFYFFAYQSGLAGGRGFGIGNWIIERDEPIRTKEDLDWVAEEIRVANPGNTSVIILSWQHFEE